MRIEQEVKLAFKDVLIRPKRSKLRSRREVDITREFVFPNSKAKWRGVPIITANMDRVSTFAMAQELSKHQAVVALHKHYTLEELLEFVEGNPEALPYTCFSSGTGDDDWTKLTALLDQTEEKMPHAMLCLDVANGYSEHFIDYVRKVRERFPQHTIMAGNVVTPEMTEELIMTGADIVKVGIGPGSACTTRRVAGVGYPQLSAVIECSDAAHGLNGMIVSDGGCTVPADFAKAIGGGADFVMTGGMFAGHDECGGEIIEKNGKQYMEFWGMSSATAMKKHAGGVAEYRSSEGKHVLVPYRGPVERTLLHILGGLRSCCTYVGARRLKELSKRTTFIRVTQQTNDVYNPTTLSEM